MTLAELPTEQLDGLMEDFLPQTRPDMCYSAGLVNIINELGARDDHVSMKYSLTQMNRICGYREGRHCQDSMVPQWVSEELEPYGYRFVQEQGKDADRELLTTIVEDPRKSYPLVNVIPDYFDQAGIRHRGAYQWDHVLVIMGMDHEVVYFYDPCRTFYSRAPSVLDLPKHMPIPVSSNCGRVLSREDGCVGSSHWTPFRPNCRGGSDRSCSSRSTARIGRPSRTGSRAS